MHTGEARPPRRNRSETPAPRTSPTPWRGPGSPAREATRDLRTGQFEPRAASPATGRPARLVLVALLFLAVWPQPSLAAAAPDLAEALAGCLPAPEQGWSAEPVLVDAAKTDLKAHEIWASRQYKQTEGGGEVDIKIQRSRWCCWLINFSGDLKKTTVKGRKAGTDEQRDESTIYVRVKKHLVVSIQAENLPQPAQVADRFASGIDYDKLEALVYP